MCGFQHHRRTAFLSAIAKCVRNAPFIRPHLARISLVKQQDKAFNSTHISLIDGNFSVT